MAGLIDSLTSASRSLDATRLGLEVAGQNLANINTEGYTRRTLVLAEVPPAAGFIGAGRGVEVLGIEAARDALIEARVWSGARQSGFDAAVVDGLTELEATIGTAGASLDQRITAFFDAFKTLADDPTSPAARDGVVRQGTELSRAFNQLADEIVGARRTADASIRSSVDEINRLAARIAQLNGEIVNAGGAAEALRDEQTLAVTRLSELAGVSVIRREDGGVDVSLGAGRPLVISATSYSLSIESTAPLGLSAVTAAGVDITAEISAGRIGGLLQLRDTFAPAYQGAIDALAFGFATEVNTLHATGFDANGNAGGAFFDLPGTATGAAAGIAVSAALSGDSALVAASGTGAIGDNAVAQAIAALRDTRTLNGGTATAIEAWGQFVYRVGADLSAAHARNATQTQIMNQLDRLRDQVSGVSMDEEAANLIRFQRAYEANARYFTTIVDTLDVLLNMVR